MGTSVSGTVFEEKSANIQDGVGRTGGDKKVPMPIMLDLDSDEDDEQGDHIIEKALDKAPEKDLVDLAGILGECFLSTCAVILSLGPKGRISWVFQEGNLVEQLNLCCLFVCLLAGMHNVLNQSQYYNALKGKAQDENSTTTFDGVIKAYQPRIVPDEPDNETNVDECIQ